MSVDAASGLIAWPQPGLAGTYAVTLTATDRTGLIASQSYALQISDSRNRPPVISNRLPATGQEGQRLSHQVQASDPDSNAVTYTLGTQLRDRKSVV